MHRTLAFPVLNKTRYVIHSCNTSTQETEKGRPEGYLAYVRPCLKFKRIINKRSLAYATS